MGQVSGGMNTAYTVAFVTNLIEKIYKDDDHKITLAENTAAQKTDSETATLSAKAIAQDGLLDDEQKVTALSTQKLYEKKTNFDKTFANLFGDDKNGVDINDVRRIFGATIDQQVLGGATLGQVISMKNTFTATNDVTAQKNIDLWVHAQGSHEGDLVGADGKRIGAVSILPDVDPLTGKAIETADAAKAAGTAAAEKAAAPNPLGELPPKADFQTELKKQLQGRIDSTFLTSEMKGHKAKGNFIQDILVAKLGGDDLGATAESNLKISANATQFLKDFTAQGNPNVLLSRQTGANVMYMRAMRDMTPQNFGFGFGMNRFAADTIPFPTPQPNSPSDNSSPGQTLNIDENGNIT